MSLPSLTNSRIEAALDVLVARQEIQKMIIVIPEGTDCKNVRGSFFVNQADVERGDRFTDCFLDLVSHVDDRFRTK
jgi:enterochelin esterase-like enzyme